MIRRVFDVTSPQKGSRSRRTGVGQWSTPFKEKKVLIHNTAFWGTIYRDRTLRGTDMLPGAKPYGMRGPLNMRAPLSTPQQHFTLLHFLCLPPALVRTQSWWRGRSLINLPQATRAAANGDCKTQQPLVGTSIACKTKSRDPRPTRFSPPKELMPERLIQFRANHLGFFVCLLQYDALYMDKTRHTIQLAMDNNKHKRTHEHERMKSPT